MHFRFVVGLRFAVSLLLVAMCCLAQGQGVRTPQRHALVIGVGNYTQIDKLPSPIKDAEAMAAKLGTLGFNVHPPVLDPDKSTLETALRAFKLKIRANDEVVLYYSGHAVQLSGENYLLPKDAPRNVEQRDDIIDRAVRLQRMLRDMEEQEARVVVAIFDACRDDPIRWLNPGKQAAGQGGLAQAAPGSGQMILYATSANRTAVDRLNHNDNDPNSLFTRVLLQEIGKPGISVAQMAKTVQGRVRDLATRAQRVQIPAIYDQMPGDFYLMSMGPLSQAQAVSAPAPVASPNFGMTVGSHYLAFPGGPALTLLPQGSYLRGSHDEVGRSNDEGPVRVVTVNYPLLIGTYEITHHQFSEFVRATGYSTDAERDSGELQGCVAFSSVSGNFEWIPGLNWRSPGFPVHDLQPAVCLSWNDAQAYVAWLNHKAGLDYLGKDDPRRFRLPSESEWEYAARGVTDPASHRAGAQHWRYFWGEDPQSVDVCRYANAIDNTPGPNGQLFREWLDCRDGNFFAALVGTYQPNPFGLFDILGNAQEWVQDCYVNTYERAPNDGRAENSSAHCSRVLRGGGWGTYISHLRIAKRDFNSANFRVSGTGFRIARSLAPR